MVPADWDHGARQPKVGHHEHEQCCTISLGMQWLDVISTVTLLAVPRYLQFYRRLYLGGGGFWAASGRYTLEELDTRVESLTACPDEILLGIAEISSLECWKVQEMRKGTLSMRELIRRGDILERHLRIECEPACAPETDQTRLHPGSAMSSDPTTTGLPRTASPADVARQLVAKIFRETALVYLYTVLNGSYPGALLLLRDSSQEPIFP